MERVIFAGLKRDKKLFCFLLEFLYKLEKQGLSKIFTVIFYCLIMFIGFCYSAKMYCSSGMSYNKLPEQKWTWCYKKVFSQEEIKKNSKLDRILFFKENVNNFSQLIFSFNAIKPKKGGFLFYIKSRNCVTKKWSSWNKMFDWSLLTRRSFFSVNPDSQYVHVRLETGQKELADAFKIAIKPYDGANLDLIKSVCACVSDFNKFKYEVIDKNILGLKSVHIKGVPKISQRLVDHKESSRICSPVSCSMLVGYFNKNDQDPVAFADSVFDAGLGETGSYGNWPFNVAELYCRCNYNRFFYVQRLNAFVDLYDKLYSGCPVVVSVRGKLEGGQKVYSNGHLIVVVGWDCNDKTVICHDPAFYTTDATFVKYKLETFLRGWESSNRLAYIADKK